MRVPSAASHLGRRVLPSVLIGLLLAALTVNCAGSETSAGASMTASASEAREPLGMEGGPARVAAVASQGP
ncbi:MAG: hypothetical protein OXG65_02290, partial [Chloroflexi bacterium]|nr:hypothetical protein [Chloroflexota bacterium]